MTCLKGPFSTPMCIVIQSLEENVCPAKHAMKMSRTMQMTFAVGQVLPIAFGVVEGFRQRFPKRDARDKTDMLPAQAIETFQCIDTTNR